MQAQAEVGVFGGVLGCLIDRHLVETDLLRSLAAEHFVGDRREAEVTSRELTQIVAANAVLAGFEDVRLQQCVVCHTGEMNAVVGQYMLVVLEVLADLRVSWRFEPGLETRQHFVARQLRWCSGVVVGER
jgi:hypothetical protein